MCGFQARTLAILVVLAAGCADDEGSRSNHDGALADLGGDAGAEVGVPDECVQDDQPVPCNGCPVGTVVPNGMVCVRAGRFIQGERENFGEERAVTLRGHFFLARTEVSQGEWLALMDENPSEFSSCGADCPVEQVTWLEAVAYANARSLAEGLAPCYDAEGEAVGPRPPYRCEGYRLPTEAEWEYACRAGTQTQYFWGDDIFLARDHAWYDRNAEGMTHRVAQKRPNGWGLFDMSGNVREWAHDRFGPYSAQSITDPSGAEAPEVRRVSRNGGWFGSARYVRCAQRSTNLPDTRTADVGLRLARSSLR